MLEVFGIWRALKGWRTILASVGVADRGRPADGRLGDHRRSAGDRADAARHRHWRCDPEVADRHPGRAEGPEIAWFRRRSAGLTLGPGPFAVYSAFRRYSGSASYQGPHVWENSDQSSARRRADRICTDRFRPRGVCGQLPVGGRGPGRGAERRRPCRCRGSSKQIRKAAGGEILPPPQLCNVGGQLVYLVNVLDRDGQVTRLTVDAASGAILGY